MIRIIINCLKKLTIKIFLAPSPRQRSRIRTNPWISNSELESSNHFNSFDSKVNTFSDKKSNRDSMGSTMTSSSGINLISNSDSNERKEEFSESESSTEKPCKNSSEKFVKLFPKKQQSAKFPISISTTQHDGSDEDATLNEIGKFDESYVYEKENDFHR